MRHNLWNIHTQHMHHKAHCRGTEMKVCFRLTDQIKHYSQSVYITNGNTSINLLTDEPRLVCQLEWLGTQHALHVLLAFDVVLESQLIELIQNLIHACVTLYAWSRIEQHLHNRHSQQTFTTLTSTIKGKSHQSNLSTIILNYLKNFPNDYLFPLFCLVKFASAAFAF